MFVAAKEKYQLAGHPENLAHSDPAYAVSVLRLWQDAALLQSKPDGTLKHNAWEHMAAGAIYAEAIGQRIGLTREDLDQLKLAYRLHDADKDTESAVVNAARSKDVSWDNIEAAIRAAHPIYEELPLAERIVKMQAYDEFEDRILAELKEKYSASMNPNVEDGERVYVARDLIVGGWHDAKLAFEGVDPKIIEMQATTEYSASPTVDELLNDYATADARTRLDIVKRVITYAIDNSMDNAKFIDPDVRCDLVFSDLKPANVVLSKAYAKHSGTGETALEMQKRVGRRAVNFLSGLMGISSDKFVETVEQDALQSI